MVHLQGLVADSCVSYEDITNQLFWKVYFCSPMHHILILADAVGSRCIFRRRRYAYCYRCSVVGLCVCGSVVHNCKLYISG